MIGFANPARLGVIGVTVAAVLLAAALAVPKLTFLARTTGFTAQFSNAAGLAADAQVMVAGVPAGRVTGVRLAGDHVEIDFRLDSGQALDDQALAYDYRSMDRNFTVVARTPPGVAAQYQGVSVETVLEAGGAGGVDSHVDVVLFIDQKITNTQPNDPAPTAAG
jgi:hypothetical protein